MGTINHDLAVVVTYRPVPEFETWRASLPKDWQRLAIGPVRGIVNGDDTYLFLPDHSKEWWETSDLGNEYRQQFIELFKAARTDVVTVSWGELVDGADAKLYECPDID